MTEAKSLLVKDAKALEDAVDELTGDIAARLARLPDLDDAARVALSRRLTELIAALGPARYADAVPAEQRILHHLIGSRDGARADDFVIRGGLRLTGRDVDVTARVNYADLADVLAGVPDDAFVLSADQTPLRSRIRHVRGRDGDLVVTGWAHIANVPAEGQRVTATLVAGNGREIALSVRQHDDDGVDENVPAAGPSCAVRPSGLTVTVPLTRVPAGRWTIRLEVRVGDLVRIGPWSDADVAGGAGRRQGLSAGAGRAATVEEDDEGRLRIVVHRPCTTVSSVDVDREGRLVLTGAGDPPGPLVLVRRTDGAEVGLAPHPAGAGWGAALLLADIPIDEADVRVWTLWEQTGERRIAVRNAAGSQPPWRDPRVLPGSDDKGRMVLRLRPAAVSVVDVRLGSDAVEMDLLPGGLDATLLRARLDSMTSGVREVAGSLAPGPDGLVTAGFGLHQPQWGTVRILPTGRYPLEVRNEATGRAVPVTVGPALVDRMPLDVTEHGKLRFQVRTSREAAGLGVRLLPPLRATERGAAAVARLRGLALSGQASTPAVFFRSLFGEAANDSALAIHRELHRRGAPLDLYWSVQDHSVPLPEGGIPLLEGSEEWHRMLGEAAYVVLNQHEPRWYRKVPGQVVVQTFHGYPYKLMGRDWWALKDTPADLIASNYRVTRDWDYLVSPSAYATPLLLAAFFDDEGRRSIQVVEEGYPRNDILLSDEAGSVRRRTRAALGIGEDRTVVLYAPTFRDYLRVDETRARAADFFDPAQAAAALGPEYVVLVRGHAYHARTEGATADVPGVLDVTHYPDVADLCLASDAAVLDYSSLRFDYALLRRPMVFLVPDREEYHRMRPGLLDYDLTAPGPQVRSTGEAVERLRDLGAIRSQYGDDVERFVATYMEREDGSSAARVVDRIFGSDAGR